ncbi:MAG: GGDEF domain-containing protein [Proteobacteria bacterium]|nr:GGDEF domain-containing protein [Pseudomonadota bacterium]MBU1594874.1 GGDEF domain-containing protein [Pseudomonadota bacterium]
MNVKALLEDGASSEYLSHLFSIERYAWMALSYDMALAVDMDGCILAANSAWARASGHWPEVLRGQYLLEFMDFDDRERVLAQFQSLITSDAATTTFDFRFRCEDNSYKRFNWNMLYSPDNEVFYCIVKDLSDVHDLRHAAYHDTLTGLPNRLFLTDAMPRLIESAQEHKHILGLMFLDLDGFKQVNDTLGHQAGDVLLQTVAERLRRCVSRPENCVRLGGDEFVLMETWPCDCHGADRLASGVIASVNEPVFIDGKEVHVGVSIGIALFPQDATAPNTLMELADQAMYRAKRSGKNRFVYAGELVGADRPAALESAAAEA